MTKKTCSKCYRELHIDNFYFDSFENRHKSRCKDCHREISRNNYHKNRDRYIINMKKYRDNNKDKYLEQKKDYYNKNKDNIKKRIKRYYSTEHGKNIRKKVDSRRYQNYNWIELIPNIFGDEVKINHHHINNLFVVPIPESKHRKFYAGSDIDKHRNVCNDWIISFMNINLEEILDV